MESPIFKFIHTFIHIQGIFILFLFKYVSIYRDVSASIVKLELFHKIICLTYSNQSIIISQMPKIKPTRLFLSGKHVVYSAQQVLGRADLRVQDHMTK